MVTQTVTPVVERVVLTRPKLAKLMMAVCDRHLAHFRSAKGADSKNLFQQRLERYIEEVLEEYEKLTEQPPTK